MCESKASIWWKTLHWSQCNSYAGMHGHIQMPSRYLTNFNEEVCLLPYSSGVSHDQYRSQFTYSEIFGRTVAYWLVHQELVGRTW